ncbi:MAG: PQQ-binding-like beta-propeller repeat protein [Chitinophagaceae bacterium]|nr:PQQ-binding-like beta-propeller repeat protein [Chitinophagaceae bacterium]
MKIGLYLPILTAFVLVACSGNGRKKSEIIWSQNFPVIGSQSSPRTEDLNKDGTLDIVMGAGKNEFQESDMGIVAFDGKTGNLLWKQHSIDQVFGSATFCDINGDSIGDIFIGGRSPQLKALDGKTGAVIWTYNSDKYKDDSILKYARYNFNNSVLVPDQNGDGIQDLLTVNGGNALANPYETRNRYPGVLIIFDCKTGNVIAADTMPDGKESYMTPLCFSQPGGKELNIVFGTGGETISGSLYVTTVSDLKAKKLSAAKVVATETGHGFIAPPTLADVTKDGYLDIIAITHGSKAFAIDGRDHHTLWTKTFPGTECSDNFAVGYFTDDDVPDFFTFVSKGQWPNSTGSLQVMLNGANGNVEYEDSIGCTGFSSPVVYDLDNDGRDEVILSVNEFDCSLGYASTPPREVVNKLIFIEFRKKRVEVIDEGKGVKNIFSTPWIGDLDGNGYLDIINCQYYHHADLLLFLGMIIKRIETPVKIKKDVAWGAFLGSASNGIFTQKK